MSRTAKWSDSGYEALGRLLAERAGLSFDGARLRAVEAETRIAMELAGVDTLSAYVELVAADPAALDDLLTEITVGETFFFRDPGHFEFIRRRVVPDFLRRSGSRQVLRVWSAGCATGEEAYTLAIVLQEEGVPAHVLGTDVSRRALDVARRARYRSWSVRGLDDDLVARYFTDVPGRERGDRCWEADLHETYRKPVSFEYHNLAVDQFPSFSNGTQGLDLILCRNVLIYFDRRTVCRVAERLARCVSDGGWIISGPSDPPLEAHALLEPVLTDWGVFYRRRSRGARRLPRLAPAAHARSSAAPEAPAWGVKDRRRKRRSVEPSSASVATLSSPSDARSELVGARDALREGEYALAVEWSRKCPQDPAACAIHVRALANIDATEALVVCSLAAERHPLAVELQYLRTVLLAASGRGTDALRVARRVVYLDPSLAVGHFVLAALLRSRGHDDGARRAYATARDLCVSRPPDEALTLADGEEAGRMAEVARIQLESLGALPADDT